MEEQLTEGTIPRSISLRGVNYGTPNFYYQAFDMGEWKNILTESVRSLENHGTLILWNPISVGHE